MLKLSLLFLIALTNGYSADQDAETESPRLFWCDLLKQVSQLKSPTVDNAVDLAIQALQIDASLASLDTPESLFSLIFGCTPEDIQNPDRSELLASSSKELLLDPSDAFRELIHYNQCYVAEHVPDLAWIVDIDSYTTLEQSERPGWTKLIAFITGMTYIHAQLARKKIDQITQTNPSLAQILAPSKKENDAYKALVHNFEFANQSFDFILQSHIREDFFVLLDAVENGTSIAVKVFLEDSPSMLSRLSYLKDDVFIFALPRFYAGSGFLIEMLGEKRLRNQETVLIRTLRGAQSSIFAKNMLDLSLVYTASTTQTLQTTLPEYARQAWSYIQKTPQDYGQSILKIPQCNSKPSEAPLPILEKLIASPVFIDMLKVVMSYIAITQIPLSLPALEQIGLLNCFQTLFDFSNKAPHVFRAMWAFADPTNSPIKMNRK